MQAQVMVKGVQTCVPGHVPAQTGNGALPQVGSRLVDVVVATAVLVLLLDVDVVLPGTLVDVVAGQPRSCDVPGRATAPGPGMSAELSTVLLPEAGMQKTLTSVEGFVELSPMQTPAGAPVSLIVRAGP